MAMTLEIDGFEQIAELHDRVAFMASHPQKKYFRSQLNKSVNPLVKAYRNAAPQSEYTRRLKKMNRGKGIKLQRSWGVSLKQSVGKSVRSRSDRKPSRAKVGFNVGRKTAQRRAPHAHLAILGTQNRFTGRLAYRGRVNSTARMLRNRIRANFNSALSETLRNLRTLTLNDIARDWQA